MVLSKQGVINLAEPPQQQVTCLALATDSNQFIRRANADIHTDVRRITQIDENADCGVCLKLGESLRQYQSSVVTHMTIHRDPLKDTSLSKLP